jgi:hypothetical protein
MHAQLLPYRTRIGARRPHYHGAMLINFVGRIGRSFQQGTVPGAEAMAPSPGPPIARLIGHSITYPLVPNRTGFP